MRTKSWLFWVTWKSIFGKDRAGGVGAEEMDVAPARARAQMRVSLLRTILRSKTILLEIEENKLPQTKFTKGHKQGSDSFLMEFLSNLHAETNSELEMIPARIGYKFDLGKARREVFYKLGDVDGLTLK
ncbi:hypothetical protein SASPL_154225 [Salvia splendens]|uniref:Uncharacterized protein n=1 Tax=Salvia splendens TaxID=180675 RepID=A0A8X8VZR4_SALSN|nr:hypothetical protein SASPL_154225 [Salvia splendens]